MNTFKSFSKQFGECEDQGYLTEKEFESFEEHPEILPAFIELPKFDKMREAIKSGELKGFEFYLCGRFGGQCNSGHSECRKMRGIVD